VDHEVEALLRSWKDEVAGEQVVLRLADAEGVLAARVALLEPLLADRVGTSSRCSSWAAFASVITECIHARVFTVFAGKSRTTERPCLRISTRCGPMAARSRAEYRA
jgi:hypothetical protein